MMLAVDAALLVTTTVPAGPAWAAALVARTSHPQKVAAAA
jgi:hypothetical protein